MVCVQHSDIDSISIRRPFDERSTIKIIIKVTVTQHGPLTR